MRTTPIVSFFLMSFFLVPTVLGAVVFLTGSVVANVALPQTINYKELKINQDVTRTLMMVESPVTTQIKIDSLCQNPGTFTGAITLPIGSSVTSLGFNTNGTTIIQPNISIGNITLAIRGVAQGSINCTLNVDGGNFTNFTISPQFE